MNRKGLFTKIILLLFLFFTFYIGNLVFFPQQLPSNEYRITVNKNQSLSKLAVLLEDQKVIKSSKVFLYLLELLRKDKKINAGVYILKHPISLWGIVFRLSNGQPDQISITILEGWTFLQLKQYIDTLEDIQHITTNQTETDIKNTLKINLPNLEGVFLPDTYFIAPNQTDLEIYQQAYKLMQLKIESLYSNRSPIAHVNSPYQLLILASLVQKETNNVTDMYLISTVFNNRLRVGMKLQDDPAVFYGLRGRDKVTRSDFLVDTPYNTYLHTGLTPTPICIPGLDALKASANPMDKQNVYYFIGIGGGRTKFSETYKDHMGAVSKYLKKSSK
ncbi:MAG: endolytic transglycosylase MltG [Proteobacteria bacterium]|nr:endolytic transglycosylase MltG [Pseudomonadota bacterium]